MGIRRKSSLITSETYCHLEPAFLKGELDQLMNLGAAAAQPPPSITPSPASANANGTRVSDEKSPRFATRLLPDPSPPRSRAHRRTREPKRSPRLPAERDTGLEPATFSLGS